MTTMIEWATNLSLFDIISQYKRNIVEHGTGVNSNVLQLSR